MKLRLILLVMYLIMFKPWQWRPLSYYSRVSAQRKFLKLLPECGLSENITDPISRLWLTCYLGFGGLSNILQKHTISYSCQTLQIGLSVPPFPFTSMVSSWYNESRFLYQMDAHPKQTKSKNKNKNKSLLNLYKVKLALFTKPISYQSPLQTSFQKPGSDMMYLNTIPLDNNFQDNCTYQEKDA